MSAIWITSPLKEGAMISPAHPTPNPGSIAQILRNIAPENPKFYNSSQKLGDAISSISLAVLGK